MKKRFENKTNILLVNITRLGDMIQSTPTIIGLKQENPNAKITVLVEKQFESICYSIPEIDEVIPIDLGMTVRSISREGDGIIDAYEYVDELVEKLKSKNFDYCLNMSSSAYTALLLSLVDVKRRGGWTADSEGYRLIESDWAKLFATAVFHQNRKYSPFNLVDIFRCAGDVEKHPNYLKVAVSDEAREYCKKFIQDAKFTNTGPLLVVQAGASQAKRQWAPSNFIKCVRKLVKENNVRVVLSGTKKELSIIEPIKEGCDSDNVVIAAGKTNIPQLAALLEMSDLLLTGDTGTMHMSIAVGTPVVSMFLASAFGFETGPYSDGNIVLQPNIGCYPCNPNKLCSTIACHFTFDPEDLARIVLLRLKEDFKELPEGIVQNSNMTVFRTYFDEFGFYDLKALNYENEPIKKMRESYRKLWLDDLGNYVCQNVNQNSNSNETKIITINTELPDDLPWKHNLFELRNCAKEGQTLIVELEKLIKDKNSSAKLLGDINKKISELDRKIEQLGYDAPELAPLSRMFIFSKENILGTEVLDLASQTKEIYNDLERRTIKLENYFLSNL
ncbi:MAG: glycosyltransferase family 9 protein [Bdellovibrionota bacterium]|nr:glycosyltransferase family 9 protein [Pseudomonadota bacterium]MDY6090113.1 glycosyltransferase family 9 protein [Bdellovibrionota bacterium]